ncbi:MAG: Hpt domain-containing protein [Hyphomonadaceae bacterium]
MAKEKPIEIINPPNMLKVKVGGSLPQVDQRAIARAEAALAKLSEQFTDWIAEELERLVEAWNEFDAKGDTPETRLLLHRRAHDLKGLAPTFGFPLIGRVCSSMSKLTSDEHATLKIPPALLRAHVDAVRAIVAGDIRQADHPVGATLAQELEDRTRQLIDAAAA